MKQLNWWKSIASFLVVLFTMPLGHALMMIMDKTMTPEAVHYSAFFMGLAGLIMVVIGVVVLLGYIMIASKRRLTLNQVNNEENNLEKTT